MSKPPCAPPSRNTIRIRLRRGWSWDKAHAPVEATASAYGKRAGHCSRKYVDPERARELASAAGKLGGKRRATVLSPDVIADFPMTKRGGRAQRLRFWGREARVSEWAALVGVEPHVIYSRLHLGWSPARAISTPVYANRKLDMAAVLTIRACCHEPAKTLAERFGVSAETIRLIRAGRSRK